MQLLTLLVTVIMVSYSQKCLNRDGKQVDWYLQLHLPASVREGQQLPRLLRAATLQYLVPDQQSPEHRLHRLERSKSKWQHLERQSPFKECAPVREGNQQWNRHRPLNAEVPCDCGPSGPDHHSRQSENLRAAFLLSAGVRGYHEPDHVKSQHCQTVYLRQQHQLSRRNHLRK